MSAIAEEPPEPKTSAAVRSDRPAIDREHGLDVCPFLRSRDGAWASAFASRDLRCWAVVPAAQLSPQKQRDLCVSSAHASCATFMTAEASDRGLGRQDPDDAALWPVVSNIPIALESIHARPGVNVSSPRVGTQALLVGLMVVALIVLVIARTNPLAGAGASPSPGGSASPDASAAAVAPLVASAPPLASASDSPSPAPPSPTLAPSATPSPSAAQRTYRVRSGDTIASIAAKFHTTVKAIVKANNIVDPRTIHPGQALIIP
jgi:hypothetical protein